MEKSPFFLIASSLRDMTRKQCCYYLIKGNKHKRFMNKYVNHTILLWMRCVENDR